MPEFAKRRPFTLAGREKSARPSRRSLAWLPAAAPVGAAPMRRIEGRLQAGRIASSSARARQAGFQGPADERHDRAAPAPPLRAARDHDGPRPDGGGIEDDPDRRLARARSRQARALALHRVRGRKRATGPAVSRSTSASRICRNWTRTAEPRSSAGSPARLSCRRRLARRCRMSKSRNGSRCCRQAPSA